MSEKIIVHGNELYHFGIKGQKWGERRWQNEDGSLTPEGYEHYGYKKGSLKDKMMTAKRFKNTSREAKAEYKKAKNEYKYARKQAEREAYDKSSFLEKMTYSYGTYNSAGKKMVDKNMSYEDAMKASKKEAWRNTAIMTAVAAGLTVAELYAMGNN